MTVKLEVDELGRNREKEGLYVLMSVLMYVIKTLTRNMLTHNRDFSPVQTNQCYSRL